MQGVRRPVIKKKRASTGNCCNIERVIGITAQSNSGVAVSPNASEIAYTAAGCIVLYNVPTNQ